MRRKVLYVTGTRADFGLMTSTLEKIARSPALDLGIVATGMHLDARYGSTIREVEATGIRLAGHVEVEEGEPTGALMAKNIGRMLIGFVDIFAAEKPDLVLVLGDRGEMLAGALAAIHLNVPVAHLHGGERSGTIDEPIRHAISKLSHYHFVASKESRERLLRMGEEERRIFVVGAPGLDGLAGLVRHDRREICARYGLDPRQRFAMMVFHPVVQEAEASGPAADLVLARLRAAGVQVLALMPNSDAGSQAVRDVLTRRHGSGEIALATHLSREQYVSALAVCDVLVGNSSSGIIEAATFGTPVVNIGSRQNLRQRNANVIDAGQNEAEIDAALRSAFAAGRREMVNVYGDGRAGSRIVRLLETVDLGSDMLLKANAY